MRQGLSFTLVSSDVNVLSKRHHIRAIVPLTPQKYKDQGQRTGMEWKASQRKFINQQMDNITCGVHSVDFLSVHSE